MELYGLEELGKLGEVEDTEEIDDMGEVKTNTSSRDVEWKK